MSESLRRFSHRYTDPLYRQLGDRYDTRVDVALVRQQAIARSGGVLPPDQHTAGMGHWALARELDAVLEHAVGHDKRVSVAQLSYLESGYDVESRQGPGGPLADSWFRGFQTSRRVASLLRDSVVDLLAGIKPGASEVLAP